MFKTENTMKSQIFSNPETTPHESNTRGFYINTRILGFISTDLELKLPSKIYSMINKHTQKRKALLKSQLTA